MELLIDSSNKASIFVALRKGKKELVARTLPAHHNHGEILLPLIESLRKSVSPTKKISSIRVSDRGDGFSSLRIGIATANALAFALNIPIANLSGNKKVASHSLIKPRYNSEPRITQKYA